MSYTEIYAFDKEGNAFLADEVHNAWRGAMAIWDILENKYLPPYIPNYIKSCYWYRPNITKEELKTFLGYEPKRTTPSFGSDNPTKEIWELADNPEIPINERIVLFTTFDNCLVKKENIGRVIKAFREFEGETSLKEQADILERLSKNENVIAVGWNQMSVCADTWSNCGGYDEEKDKCIPYNCLTGDKHYWLFDELEELKWL